MSRMHVMCDYYSVFKAIFNQHLDTTYSLRIRRKIEIEVVLIMRNLHTKQIELQVTGRIVCKLK